MVRPGVVILVQRATLVVGLVGLVASTISILSSSGKKRGINEFSQPGKILAVIVNFVSTVLVFLRAKPIVDLFQRPRNSAPTTQLTQAQLLNQQHPGVSDAYMQLMLRQGDFSAEDYEQLLALDQSITSRHGASQAVIASLPVFMMPSKETRAKPSSRASSVVSHKSTGSRRNRRSGSERNRRDSDASFDRFSVGSQVSLGSLLREDNHAQRNRVRSAPRLSMLSSRANRRASGSSPGPELRRSSSRQTRHESTSSNRRIASRRRRSSTTNLQQTRRRDRTSSSSSQGSVLSRHSSIRTVASDTRGRESRIARRSQRRNSRGHRSEFGIGFGSFRVERWELESGLARIGSWLARASEWGNRIAVAAITGNRSRWRDDDLRSAPGRIGHGRSRKGGRAKSSSGTSSSSMTTRCPICLFSMRGELVKMMPCMHQFHAECLDPWLRIKADCPVCKCSVHASLDE